MPHRFIVGQDVRLIPSMYARSAANGAYKVIRQLPFEGEEHRYRIKSAAENFERVVRESELERAA